MFECSNVRINALRDSLQTHIIYWNSVKKESLVYSDEMRRRVSPNPHSNIRTFVHSNISQRRVQNRTYRALSVRTRDVDGLELQLRIVQRGAEVPDGLQSGLHPEATAGGKFVKEAHRETATATTAETAYPPMISQSNLSERRTRSGRPTSPFRQARNR